MEVINQRQSEHKEQKNDSHPISRGQSPGIQTKYEEEEVDDKNENGVPFMIKCFSVCTVLLATHIHGKGLQSKGAQRVPSTARDL